MSIWEIISLIAIALISAVAGVVAGFYYARKKTENYLKDNPPISEKQIRAMYLSMGRKPSESQVLNTLRAMGIKKK